MKPLEAWQDRIDQSELIYDRLQAEAVDQLEAFYHHLKIDQKQAGGLFSKLYHQLLGKSEQAIEIMSYRGLYLHGGAGRGKSMLMDLFHDTVEGISKRRVHFHQFMLEVHDWLKLWREQDQIRDSKQDPLPLLANELATQTRLYCFDEFHIRDVADAMILSRLFAAMVNEGIMFVVTSNQAPDKLYESGLQREHLLPFIDLLQQQFQIIHLDSDQDYRRLQEIERAKNPLLSQYAKQLIGCNHKDADEIFKIVLTNFGYQQAEGKPFILTHKGRKIEFNDGYKHREHAILMTGFSELCMRPLGVVDYLVLIREFDLLIITDIPILDTSHQNPCKRFMHLIDVVYESQIQLLLALPVAIDDLCQHPRLAEEFKRTASRLHELL